MTDKLTPTTGYSIGHPWHYVLGGAIPTLKQIRAQAIGRGYLGYMARDIEEISKRAEPKRSQTLRKIRAKVMDDLQADISRYRELVRELQKFQRANPANETAPICHDVHTSISLKFAHIYNGFAHLAYLDNLPDQQQDLFDML